MAVPWAAIRRMWDYFVTHLQGGAPPAFKISGEGEATVSH
jgi:hypothetical protein